nr:MAG TPA: hypothetical protein [Caudoviricetes sp.]
MKARFLTISILFKAGSINCLYCRLCGFYYLLHSQNPPNAKPTTTFYP